MRTLWNNTVLAVSDDTVSVEGHRSIQERSLTREDIVFGHRMTSCAWKRQASYYSWRLHGERNPDAVWCDADSKFQAAPVRGLVTFTSRVKVP